MSDVTVRWAPTQDQEMREETFKNVRLELLAVGAAFIGWMVKGKDFQTMLFFSRMESLSEQFEHDPRDDDKPDKSTARISLVPK